VHRSTIVCAMIVGMAFLMVRANAAPSFDCKAATSAVEFLICGNDALSNDDVMVSATYKRAIELSAKLPIDSGKLLKDQREWLGSRSRFCSVPGKKVPDQDVAKFKAVICLSGLYKDREAAIDRSIEDGDRQFRHLEPDPADVISTSDIAEGEELQKMPQVFQTNGLHYFFHTPEVSIDSCDDAMDLVVQGPGHDSSFGAHCKVRVGEQPVDVLMCSDYMIGKFGIQLSDGAPTRESMAQFIVRSCRPGG